MLVTVTIGPFDAVSPYEISEIASLQKALDCLPELRLISMDERLNAVVEIDAESSEEALVVVTGIYAGAITRPTGIDGLPTRGEARPS